MTKALQLDPGPRDSATALRVARLAERQLGAVSWGQLRACGMSTSAISRAAAAGRLHRILPRVYAVGHKALSVEGRLTAALLYAGPGAALSHTSAGWWWGLLLANPTVVHVSAPRRRRSAAAGLRVHHPRRLECTRRRGLPVTPVARTLLDLASTLPFNSLRRVVAEAEFKRLVDLADLELPLAGGPPGSAALRAALQQHRPELARTHSVLEERFLGLCERFNIPIPEVNVALCGFIVDAVWRNARLVVELDGAASHEAPGRVRADRHRELVLREAGFKVRRYSWQQIGEEPGRVAEDLLRALGAG